MASRKTRATSLVGVAASSLRKSCPQAWAQIPPITGLGTGAGAGGTAASALGAGGLGTAAAAPRTLWGFLGITSANFAACKEKICSCQLGQMANSLLTGPIGAVSGGFISHLCPPAPSPAAIDAMEKKPNGGAEAAAAKIKASEADAKARVAAVEYLGTVDCNRFPEAKKGLISALREDPNECVRLAAAKALSSGCCCDQEVIEALKICVSGEAKGAPAETSPRVKAAAFSALQGCLMRVTEVVEEPQQLQQEPEGGNLPEALPNQGTRARPEGAAMRTTDPEAVAASLQGSQGIERKSFNQTVNEARRTLFEAAQTPQQPGTLAPGKRSLYDAFVKARQDVDAKARQNAPAPPEAPFDAGVVPSSYTPKAERGVIRSTPMQKSVADPSAPKEIPDLSRPQKTSPAKRGLFGLLIKSRESN